MTYGMTIHYDVDVEFIDILAQGEYPSVPIEQIGGCGVVGEETENDYKITQEFRNFKDGGENGDDDDNAEPENKDKRQQGGAPKKPRDNRKKKVREKRTIKPFDMTPALATQLREAMEKSMTSPNTQTRSITLSKIYLGKFPIMLQSDYCILNGLNPYTRHTMGECRNDLGGYFIIQGLEKTVVTQEKFADNMLWVNSGKHTTDEDGNLEYITEYIYSSEIRSVSENVSKPIRNLSVRLMAPTKKYTNLNIVVNIPNVRKPVPLFIVFRALGIISDKSIIENCLLDMDKYEHLVDLFIPSIHDTGFYYNSKIGTRIYRISYKRKTHRTRLGNISGLFFTSYWRSKFPRKSILFRLYGFQIISGLYWS